MQGIDWDSLLPEGLLKGEDEEENAQLSEMREEARGYLEKFTWCKSVLEIYSGGGVGKVVSVWLVRILPSRSDIDEYLWVIVGDIPSAYLVTDEMPTPKDALESYICYMEEWEDALANGESTDDLYPIDIEMTPELAKALGSRMRFMRERILPHFDGLVD